MKHEMTAREYAKQRARMCIGRACPDCPFFTGFRKTSIDWTNCSNFQRDYPDEAARIVEEWAAANPEPRKTILIPDEIVNELTFEATYVDKRGVELTPEAKKMRMELYAELVRKALPNADSVRCVKIQQFVTRGHEEETE